MQEVSIFFYTIVIVISILNRVKVSLKYNWKYFIFILTEPLAQLKNEPTFAADWVRLRILTLIGCTASAVALTLSLIFFVILYYQSKKEHKHTRVMPIDSF